MKHFILYTILLSQFAIACNAQNAQSQEEEETEDGPKSESQKKVSKRDLSITKANAYTTLFLDSMTLENFIKQNNLNDAITRRMRSFYNARNFNYAWFSSDGLTEQARGFWNLHDYVTTYDDDTTLRNKALQQKMDALIAEDALKVSASDKSILNTELTLTQHFILYHLNNYDKGYVKRKEMERFVPRKQEDVMYLADSLLTKKHKDDKYFEDVHERFKQLKMQLGRYYDIAKRGGWPTVPSISKSLKPGVTSPVISLIKQRLRITGDLVGNDTTQVFNDTLVRAIKNYQSRHGLKADGVITAALVKEMNIPVKHRLQQLVMNMERMRWMPNEPVSDNLIVVNIPEFMLHMYEGNKRAWDMVVVVGKEGHNTMMFTGDLNQVVFSPHWNVPPSIVRKEILPAMNRNPSYLASQNMEIVRNDGSLPVIRQKPGPGNALGQVKFLFPNSFNIYFHDTPSKSLFSRDKRAFSHGCIRLSDPYKMARYLLRNDPSWTPVRIMEAMAAGEEKFVRLKKPVPVFITYYTAWVDDNGQLNFRDDIYSHDAKLAKKMFL